MAAVTQTATLESRFVAILVVNVTSFDRSVRGLSSSELQATYSRFIDVVLRVAKACKGVLDSVQGDHVLISFNSSVRCAVPASKAVSAAFSLRNGVKELPAAWQRFTCGIAVGHAYCGTLGNVEVKSHATLGHVVRQAIGLQRIARAFDDAFDGGASAAPGQRRHSPGWCFATARVVQDCSAFAHFRYEAIAQLPPSTRLTIIASVFPPFQPLDAAATGAVTPGDGFGFPPSDAVVTHATNATDREWLYEVETTTNANPFKDANLLVATRFKSVVNISLDEANSLPPTMWSTQINDDVTRRSAPRLWGLE